ncbi:alpha/beta hydrolase [Rhodobacteraceae bacterium]|nr:alpha/beta hydrolase [Paracoccaceae bacterium]
MRLWTSVFNLLLVAGLSTGCTSWQADRREAAAEAEYPPGGQMIRFDDGEFAGQSVHLKEMGNPDGPDLVLIHGASGSLRDMTFRLAPALADTYHIYAFDRPGFGYSTPLQNDTIFAQSRLLSQAATRAGARHPIVLGHSYGGAVALAWAFEAKDKPSALVLLAAASQTWDGGLPFLYQITAPPLGQAVAVPLISAWAPESTVENAVADVFSPEAVPRGYSDHFGPEMTLRRVTMRANARQRAGLKQEIAMMVPNYPRLDLPVELLHGDQDTTVGLDIHSRKTAAQIPGATLTVLPGAGHMIQQTRVTADRQAVDRAALRAGLR